MRAAVVHSFGQPLVIEERPTLIPGPARADHVINAATHDVVDEMRKLVGADAIVSTAASPGPLGGGHQRVGAREARAGPAIAIWDGRPGGAHPEVLTTRSSRPLGRS